MRIFQRSAPIQASHNQLFANLSSRGCEALSARTPDQHTGLVDHNGPSIACRSNLDSQNPSAPCSPFHDSIHRPAAPAPPGSGREAPSPPLRSVRRPVRPRSISVLARRAGTSMNTRVGDALIVIPHSAGHHLQHLHRDLGMLVKPMEQHLAFQPHHLGSVVHGERRCGARPAFGVEHRNLAEHARPAHGWTAAAPGRSADSLISLTRPDSRRYMR